MSSIEERIVKLLFREEIVAKSMADILLPPIISDHIFWKELTSKEAYNLARINLKENLNRLLNDK